MYEDLKNSASRIVGTKQTMRAIEMGQVTEVYFAEDADEYIRKKITQLCNKNHISAIPVKTMKELGEACGIQVGAATAAILK